MAFDDLRANLREQIDTLSPRDRNLAIGLMAGIAIILVGVIAWSLKSNLDSRASRVQAVADNLQLVLEMEQEYAGVQARIEAAEKRMETFNPAQFNTYIETWATSAGVAEGLKGVRETDSQVVGNYREREYNVELSKMPVDATLKFLYALETSGYPIEVRTARFKVHESRRDGRTMNVVMEVVTYAKEEG